MRNTTDNHAPAVTVGIPVYNGERYVSQAIESILAQRFADLDVIISDNASTDGTSDICQRYAQQDRRIRYVRNERNMGAAFNYNRLVDLARGRYFKWMAHDDVCAPDLIGACVDVLEQEPRVVLCYAPTTFIDEDGRPLRTIRDGFHFRDRRPSERFRRFLPLARGWMNPVFGLYRTDVLRKTRRIGKYPSSDMILVADMALRGEIHELPESLFFRREHRNMSVRAHPSPLDRQRWFDADFRQRLVLPHWRWVGEYLRIIWEAPISQVEKGRCAWALIRWLKWTRRELLGELIMAINATLPARSS
jgi:glycosyltransferase involved in cell wall biosynthesis